MDKSPAFQFYPKDWLSDSNVIRMNHTERGIYINLLCYCWIDGSLPKDQEALAYLSGNGDLSVEDWLNHLNIILPCFKVVGDRLIHPRLEKEKIKQKEWREKSSKGGKASAKAQKLKRKAQAKGGATKEQPKGNRPAQPKGNTSFASSSSSSSSSKNIKPLRSAKDADPGRDEFENLWNQYPEKKGKHEAWLKFKSQVKSPQDLINIINALRNYKKDMDHVRRDHPDRAWLHGSTWFNKRWEDFIDYKPPPNGKPTPPKPIKVETPKPEDHVPPGELKKMVQNFTKKLKGVDE